MLHRSTLLAFLSAALLLPAAAQAADPVVAGPAADGSTFTAAIQSGQLCLTPKLPPAIEQGDVADSSSGRHCVPTPVLAPTSFDDDLGGYSRHGGGGLGAGVTGSAIAAVELRKGGRVLTRVATQPSPLPQLTNVRFYATYTTEDADEIAFLDAAGTVVRAADPGADPALPGSARVPERAKRTIVSGRTAHGGGRWALRAYTQSPIVSTPLAPERRVTSTCVTFSYSSRGHGGGSTGACDATGREAEQMLPFIDTSCGPVGLFAGAIVRSGVARLAVVLGDGTTRAIPLHALGGGLRAGVVTLGSDLAVRRMVATDGRGRTVGRFDARQAPASSRDCSEDGGFDVALVTYARGLPDTQLGAGPHRLVVADHGQDLCFAVDRAPQVSGECTAPPVDAGAVHPLSQPTTDGRFLTALVPADVAAVRVVLDDGSTRDLPAGPIPGYAGQYAQQVRAIAATVLGPRRVLAYTMLDAGGHAIAHQWTGPDGPRFRDVRILGHVAGVTGALTLSRAVAPKTVRAFAGQTCLSLGPPPTGSAAAFTSCLPDYTGFGVVLSSCAGRRTVVVLPVAHRSDRVAVRLASGRELAARTYPLPSGAHAGGIAVAVLSSHDAARTVLRRGASPKRVVMKLPAAADQCGFWAFADLEDFSD